MNAPAAAQVEHFRQVLLWPLRLMPLANAQGDRQKPWQVLQNMGDVSPWREVVDEYTGGEIGRAHV